MPLVPSIRATPEPRPDPVTVETSLTLPDWVEGMLHAHRDPLARQRRVLLGTLGVIWFLTLLALYSNWITNGGEKSVTRLLRDFDGFALLPVGVFLALCTALIGIRLWRQKAHARARLRAVAADDLRTPWKTRWLLDERGVTIVDRTDRASCLGR